MLINNLAKKIQNKILKGNQPFFFMSVEFQKKILKSFKAPSDLLERSYYQYLCQMKQLPLGLKLIQSLTAIFLTPYFYFKYSNDNGMTTGKIKKVAVFISGTKDISYVPRTLKDEFDEIIFCDYSGPYQLTAQEKRVIKQIYLRYWYKPYFCLKCMMKIALYANQVYKNNPCAVLTFGEFSFTSSALTFYCREIGIKHINIMHGEKLFNIRDSFVKFDQYYVWDQHYMNLLVSLLADKGQFKIEVPEMVKLDIKKKIKHKYELTYYLGGESEKELMNIRSTLLGRNIPRERICVRFHPRYSDKTQVSRIFSNFNIENPDEVPLNISLSQTKCVISLYSTVLFQAFKNGKEIIIDDITDSEKYEKLKKLRYIMLIKPHLRLSEIQF
ncbi:hypothetical protein ACFQ3N_01885 [Virgibacillus byunsanensis]|uniref:CDP-glycerol--glycerophosphate glycerophosphotransferase n=1 Tax=Virgibacillus byunsanensis TaxID=570945 RepID=A0ABW3LFJ7_9BACI